MSVLLIASFGHAEAKASGAFAACVEGYDQSLLLKELMGDPRDELLAPSIDRWLTTFAERHHDMPSFETYVGRLKAHDFKGDARAAFKYLQEITRDPMVKEFDFILAKLNAIEKLGSLSRNKEKPTDPGALRYAACLRAYVAKTLRALPPTSHFDLKCETLLHLIEPAR